MQASDWVVLITGLLGASVVIGGYLVSQRLASIERRNRLYAEAVSAVFAYQELPYRIRKRANDLQSAAQVATHVSEVIERLSYFQTILDLESPMVGIAFNLYAKKTRQQGREYREHAWASPAPTSSSGFHFKTPQYVYENVDERELCLAAMRADSAFLPGFRRRSVASTLAARAAALPELKGS